MSPFCRTATSSYGADSSLGRVERLWLLTAGLYNSFTICINCVNYRERIIHAPADEPRSVPIDDPEYQKRRTHTVSTLGPDSIDTPIRDLILGFATLPHCFALQNCHGYFVYGALEGLADPLRPVQAEAGSMFMRQTLLRPASLAA